MCFLGGRGRWGEAEHATGAKGKGRDGNVGVLEVGQHSYQKGPGERGKEGYRLKIEGYGARRDIGGVGSRRKNRVGEGEV